MKKKRNYIIVFVTSSTKKEAENIALYLLKKNLVACVNIINRVNSIYKWKGRIESANEVLLIIKTEKSLFKKLVKEIKRNHSYEVPEIISMEIRDGNKEYLRWLEDSIAG